MKMTGQRNMPNVLTLYIIAYLMDFLPVETMNIRLRKRYTEKDICPETKQTLNEVYSCPMDYASFRNRSLERNCNRFEKCMGQQLVYHCVRFKYEIVEVCAPRNYITGKCCPLYDEGLGRVIEDFSTLCPKCPFQYSSDDYERSALCVEKHCGNKGNRPKRDCFGGDKHDSTEKPIEASTQNMTESTHPEWLNNELNNDENVNLKLTIILPSAIIAIFFFTVTLIVYWQRKSLKRICKFSKGGLKSVKKNQDKIGFQMPNMMLSENEEECKMLPNYK